VATEERRYRSPPERSASGRVVHGLEFQGDVDVYVGEGASPTE
jgi:hypothetical protein